MNDDLYEVLAVSRDASSDEIRKAYRKLAIKFHPDKNPDDETAATQFKKVAEAYEILSDDEKRKTYDSRGMAGVQDQGFHGFDNAEDIFSQFGDIFGNRAGGPQARRSPPRRPQRGRDLRFITKIDFLQAVLGGKRDIHAPVLVSCGDCEGQGSTGGDTGPCDVCHGAGQIQREAQQTGGFFSIQSACPGCGGSGQNRGPICRTCNGDGRVNRPRHLTVTIPVGSTSGQVLRLSGQGEAGRFGGPNGDLLVELDVTPHPAFTRDGQNIRSDVKVPVATALLGGKIDVRTVNGTIALTVPPGTCSDTNLRIRGQGVPRKSAAGDHLVRVVITVPKVLTDEAAAAVREFLLDGVSC